MFNKGQSEEGMRLTRLQREGKQKGGEDKGKKERKKARRKKRGAWNSGRRGGFWE